MSKVIRIGSRESRLAVIQAEIVKKQIQKEYPDYRVELVTMKTTGDKILDRSLDKVGGKGLFVKELDQALLDGRIDLSVHSLKDMPMEVPADLPLMAYTKREDPRDVLIYKPGREEIPQNGRIGTSSRRRMIQLEKLFPGRIYTGIRGNVQTRLQKLKEQDYDATILAAAGIKRLGMEQAVGRYFSVQEMIPAAGQGILAVQGRKGEWETLASCLNHPESEIAAKTERRFVEALNGGCSSPIAAFAEIKSREFCLYGLYYRESDGAWFVETKNGTWEEAEKAGENLAVCMKQKYGE